MKEMLLAYILLLVVMLNPCTCDNFDDCLQAFSNLNPTDPNTIMMIDYTGKAVDDFGNFDGCQLLDRQVAQYCVVETEIQVNVPREVLPMYLGVCVPAVCNEASLRTALVQLLTRPPWNISQHFPIQSEIDALQVNCIPRDKEPFTLGALIAIALCSILGLLIIGGTILEYIAINAMSAGDVPEERQGLMSVSTDSGGKESLVHHASINADPRPRKRSSNKFVEFVKCWGLFSNMKWLLADNRGSGDGIILSPLNGLRTLMMAWVILGHTMTYMALPVGFDNIQWMQKKLVKRVSFQVVPAAELAVDAFFYLSGFLVVYMLLKEMKLKNGKIPWSLFYFHRYWRLTPVYMFAIFVYTTLTPYMVSGPFQYKYRSMKTDLCDKYWWTNLLYINNFYPHSSNSQCFGWGWYLANDMQFYIVTPLIAILYRSNKLIAWSVAAFLTISCMGANGILTYMYNLTNVLDPNNDVFNSMIYNKPYTRMGPYLVGVMVAFLMQEENLDITKNTFVRWAGYIIGGTVTTCATYMTYNFWSDKGWTLADNVTYESLARVGFAVGTGWAMYAFHKGHGGIVRSILAQYIWVPLARLTYPAYLVHPVMMFVINFNNATPFHYTAVYVTVRYTTHLVLAYSIALVMHLAVEKPTANLERILMPRRKH
jgi:peptidoglycan/LPS O-acetylase OafA/YrhL